MLFTVHNTVLSNEIVQCDSIFPILTGKYLGQKTPNLTPELFAPNIVSTIEYNDRDLTISPDGNQLFFARTKTGENDDYDYNIMFSELIDSIWTEPQIVWFSSNYGELEPFFTPNGKELYFNSNRPTSSESKSDHWETWVIKKMNNSWSELKLLGSPFERVCHTTFTHNGKMYYTREDITTLYRVNYKNGLFSQPEKLDTIINSAKIQYNSFISFDESYLIFTRHSQDGFGQGDLYISFRNSNDQWGNSINLGPKINSESMESSPSISPDGKFFFFTSNKRGNSDVYWIDIKFIEALKPHKFTP